MTPEDFISRLVYSNQQWLPFFARDSYQRSGGVFTPDATIGQFAADFVNHYAPGFGLALEAGVLTEDQIERRAMMYPEEGFKLAVMNGQRQAMKERQARKWRRILHPEASKAGPCDQCTADAEILHEIDDPFVEFHPNGVCSQQFLIYTFDGSEIEMPVPSDENDRTRRRWKI